MGDPVESLAIAPGLGVGNASPRLCALVRQSITTPSEMIATRSSRRHNAKELYSNVNDILCSVAEFVATIASRGVDTSPRTNAVERTG